MTIVKLIKLNKTLLPKEFSLRSLIPLRSNLLLTSKELSRNVSILQVPLRAETSKMRNASVF